MDAVVAALDGAPPASAAALLKQVGMTLVSTETPASPGGAAHEADTSPGELNGAFTVTIPHGLHARPASRVVQAVRMLDARVQLRNRTTDSTWVSAGSLSRVATVGALSGHEVEVRVSGNQAHEALDHVLKLAARGFDEAADRTDGTAAARGGVADADAPAVPAAPIPASPGVGMGPAWSMRLTPVDLPEIRADEPAAE